MLVGPAEIADRTEIDEPDLQLVGGRGAAASAAGKQKRSGGRKKCFPHGQSPNSRGERQSMTRRPIARARIPNQRSGTNTVPSAAGAVEPPVRAREIRTRTMTVARYGNADMNCEGIPKPAPCACNCRIVTAPNRYAPITRRPGRHDANTTSASPIQPRPAVMPGMKNGE